MRYTYAPGRDNCTITLSCGTCEWDRIVLRFGHILGARSRSKHYDGYICSTN